MYNIIVLLICSFSVNYVWSAGTWEGAPCVGRDNVKGKCINIYKCSSAVVVYLLYDNGAKFDYLPEICSHDSKEPRVCCTDCKIDEKEESRGYALDRFGKLVNTWKGPTVRRKCAEHFQDLPFPCQRKDSIGFNIQLAANGTCHTWFLAAPFVTGERSESDAKKRQFPHMALLGYGEDVKSAQWLCAGTVIGDRSILTAAHCTSSASIGNVTFVALGVINHTDPIETWQIYEVFLIYVHPDYKFPSKYHDIAILKVVEPIKFSNDILPACMTNVKTTYNSVQGVGWGRLGHQQNLTDNLKVAELQAFSDEKCAKLFPPDQFLQNGYNATTQACYGNENKIVDTCEGNSGGPVHIVYENCQYTVVGVTSYNIGCGQKDGAGLYTRVQHYTPWIESIVWPVRWETYKVNENGDRYDDGKDGKD